VAATLEFILFIAQHCKHMASTNTKAYQMKVIQLQELKKYFISVELQEIIIFKSLLPQQVLAEHELLPNKMM
jgi:hypothetical protein